MSQSGFHFEFICDTVIEVVIRKSNSQDSEAILDLIMELARYEKSLAQVKITAEILAKDGYGDKPEFECFVAEKQGKVVGMALFYPRYSTWKGKYLYLEDLIVTESYRGKGIGKALLDQVIAIAKERNSARLEWQVLDWNTPAIDFYKKYEADFDEEWINVRLTREKLAEL